MTNITQRLSTGKNIGVKKDLPEMDKSDELTEYQEGFTDGLVWVLTHLDLEDSDRERIEDILDA